MYYTDTLASLRRDLRDKNNLEKKLDKLENQLIISQEDYVDLMNAQKLLSTVSDDIAESTLQFITGVINKTLAEIFKNDTRRVHLKYKPFGDCRTHIIVELENGLGQMLDMEVQNGTGLRQIIAGLFVICLITVRQGRKLVIFDERFSGLHKEAKRILSEIIKIFAEGGFQFIFIEYAFNDLGQLYNVEKFGTEAKVYPLDDMDYDDSKVYLFTDVDLSTLDPDYVNDDEDEE